MTTDSGDGVTVKVWIFTASEWQNPQTGTFDVDEAVTVSLVSGVSDFVNSEGYMYLVAYTTNPSDGSDSASA